MRATQSGRNAHDTFFHCGPVSRGVWMRGAGTGRGRWGNFVQEMRACHSIGEDAANKVGPILNGLDGRKAGVVDGFNYSDANKSSGITWNEATFKEYIKDPRAKVPGTKMVFAGIKNDKELDDLWGYLKQFAANGQKK